VRYRLGEELTDRYLESVAGRSRPNTLRVPRTLPRILSPQEADRLVGALRTHRDRAMVPAMLLAGLRRCEVLGLRFADVQVADRRLAVTLADHDTAMSTASILVQEDTHYRSRTAQPTAAAHRTTASQAATEHRTVGADLPGRQLECRRPEPPAPGPVTVPQL
jgi:integrase